jgi:glycolate oxidase FAD binding subunit
VNPVDEIVDTIDRADAVVVRGAGTHRDVGGATAPGAVELVVPGGIVSYEPADMTVTVRAGTPVHELSAALAEHGQECPLDPRDDRATVGGVLACGLSGRRRLRTGPVRDRVLEVRMVTGDGRLVRGGGPTVKNVTGYDLPRLVVGSLGTLGVVVQVTLRTVPRPMVARWGTSAHPPGELRALLFKPSCLAWDGHRTSVLLEGHPDDVASEQARGDITAVDDPPTWPAEKHRGRGSVAPGRVASLGPRLDALRVSWLAEGGVGTVHIGAATEAALGAARAAVEAEGGWLLREAGAPGLDPFGSALPNAALSARIKDAFDPAGKLNPGRLPVVGSAA